MAGGPGVSFSPLNNGQVGPVTGNAGSPLQDAIKILSFRLPTVVGASGISPLAGNPGDSVANDWLLRLFQGLMPGGSPAAPMGIQGAPAAPSSAPSAPSAPSPFMGGGNPFNSPMGPSAAPSWMGAPPPPGPTSAPPPPVVHPSTEGPPVEPPRQLTPGPIQPPSSPPPVMSGPPAWRDWLGGTRDY